MRYLMNGQEVLPEDVNQLFENIEKKTGLDRAMAEAILSGGAPIRHPNFNVRALPDYKRGILK